MMRIPMKGILRAVKPREEGSTPNNIKPYETRTPNYTQDLKPPPNVFMQPQQLPKHPSLNLRPQLRSARRHPAQQPRWILPHPLYHMS
jgi:hypothetical protein